MKKKKRQEYNYIRQNDLLEHALQNRTVISLFCFGGRIIHYTYIVTTGEHIVHKKFLAAFTGVMRLPLYFLAIFLADFCDGLLERAATSRGFRFFGPIVCKNQESHTRKKYNI